METEKLRAEVKSLKEQLAAKFEKYAGNYSDDPDKKMAELMTRNAVLETELENYQKYMKAATKKYEAKIKKLKKKLKGWNNKSAHIFICTHEIFHILHTL